MSRRIPALDGVRGLAILLVLFHHVVLFSGLEAANRVDHYVELASRASWIGVDVFFVLSGFLITGILFDAKGSGRYFSGFFGRRILRIFPLYFGFLAVAWLAAPILFGGPLFGADGASPLAFLTYTSNISYAVHGWQQPLVLGHFWSLAVEEQFYLVWPFVVLAFGRRALLKITVGCFLAALALRAVVPTVLDPLAAYVLMPTRMDALAAGAFVALAVRGPRGWNVVGRVPVPVMVASGACIMWIVWTTREFSELDPIVRTIGYTAVSLFAAALLAYAVTDREGSPVRRVLEARWLVTLGTYSYGLYVLHQPILYVFELRGLDVTILPALAGSQLPGLAAVGAIAMAVSFGAAYASYHLWEMPFLRLKTRFPYWAPAGPEPTVARGERVTEKAFPHAVPSVAWMEGPSKRPRRARDAER